MRQVDHIVCIHGHGSSGDSVADWLERGLNDSLRLYGFNPLRTDDERLVSPSYFDLLSFKQPPEAEFPTFRQAGRDPDRRVAYEASLEDLRQLRGRSPAGGLQDTMSSLLPHDAGSSLTVKVAFKAVERYRKDQRFRRAVLRRVYDALPEEGSMLVLAHSLGSLVGLDLINFLPATLDVELLVTMGSPLGTERFRQFLMGKAFPWPYDRLGGWLNLFDRADLITGGNGLEEIEDFRGLVVDAPVDNGGRERHCAHSYLANAVCARVLGPLVTDLLPGGSRQLTDAEAGAAILGLYARRVAAEAPAADKNRARMKEAIKVNEMVTGSALETQGMNPEIHVTTKSLQSRFEAPVLLSRIVELFFANPFSPFDIEIKKPWQREALRFFTTELGGADEWIDDIDRLAADAIKAFQGRPWGKVLVGAGFVAAAVALPVAAVGLAGGAGLFGAAALTSGLAALGGTAGMTGGLWVVGLASAAAAGGGAALLTNLSQEQLESELAKLQVLAVLEHRLSIGDRGLSEIEALRELAEQASEWISRHIAIEGKSHRASKEWMSRRAAILQAMEWIETRRARILV